MLDETNDFSKLHTEALHWIVPGNSNVVKAKASLTGLCLSTDRIEELRGRLVAHLRNMEGHNPCYIKLQAYGSGPWPESTLLPRTAKDTLYSAFEKTNARLPVESRPSWKTFVRNRAIARLSESKLAGYIDSRARVPTSKTDKLLLNKNNILVSKGLAWRLNKMVGSKCPECERPFNRRHISECSLVEPSARYQNEHLLLYQSDVSHLYSLYGRDFVYTWLDFALNSQDWDKFEKLFDALRRRLFD